MAGEARLRGGLWKGEGGGRRLLMCHPCPAPIPKDLINSDKSARMVNGFYDLKILILNGYSLYRLLINPISLPLPPPYTAFSSVILPINGKALILMNDLFKKSLIPD